MSWGNKGETLKVEHPVMQNWAKLWTKWERHVIDFREVFCPTGCTCGRNVGRRRGKMHRQISSKIHPKIMKNPSREGPRAPQISPGTLPRDPEAQEIHKLTKGARKSREKVAKVGPRGPPGGSKNPKKSALERGGKSFGVPETSKRALGMGFIAFY